VGIFYKMIYFSAINEIHIALCNLGSFSLSDKKTLIKSIGIFLARALNKNTLLLYNFANLNI